MSLRFLVMLLQLSPQTDAFPFGYNTCEITAKKTEKFKQILFLDVSVFLLTKFEYLPIQILQFLMYEVLIENNPDEHTIIRKVWQCKLSY